jgi:guanylate kinase
MSGEPGARSTGQVTAGGVPERFQPGGFLLVISGPSGVGKSSFVRYLLEHRPDCSYSVSATTRPKRAGERNGSDYWFVTREEFERRRLRNEFLEWAEVHGHLYGTPAPYLEQQLREGRVVLLDIDVQGGATLRGARPDGVFVFIYPPSLEVLRRRLEGRRSDPPEVVERRMENAPGEMAHYREYDYLVVNDDLDQACRRLAAIVDAERWRVRRLRAEG